MQCSSAEKVTFLNFSFCWLWSVGFEWATKEWLRDLNQLQNALIHRLLHQKGNKSHCDNDDMKQSWPCLKKKSLQACDCLHAWTVSQLDLKLTSEGVTSSRSINGLSNFKNCWIKAQRRFLINVFLDASPWTSLCIIDDSVDHPLESTQQNQNLTAWGWGRDNFLKEDLR